MIVAHAISVQLRAVPPSRFRQELKYLEKRYKDDDQKELFLMGHKEMIKKLEKQLKDVRLKYSYEK